MRTKQKTLGCGHPDNWTGSGTSCTHSDGRTLCRQCATDQELSDLRNLKHAFHYLHADQRQLTSWAGVHLAEVQGRFTPSVNALTGKRLWTFRAKDVYGQLWACRFYPDSGDYVRMRKLKS